ncbi:MAG: hypothetical protein IKM11_07345, partial [Oscillospiraceae bacterium]|nr:hypothetical protein [Oscillospiraceae bacterium]
LLASVTMPLVSAVTGAYPSRSTPLLGFGGRLRGGQRTASFRRNTFSHGVPSLVGFVRGNPLRCRFNAVILSLGTIAVNRFCAEIYLQLMPQSYLSAFFKIF